MTALEYLDQEIKKVCPHAQGVSIGRWEDQSTWRVTPDILSQAERAAAHAVFTAFNKAAFDIIVDTDVVRKAEIDVALASDTTLQQLKGMTSAEFDTWWDANVTNAAQAIAVLKRLAKLVIRRLA